MEKEGEEKGPAKRWKRPSFLLLMPNLPWMDQTKARGLLIGQVIMISCSDYRMLNVL